MTASYEDRKQEARSRIERLLDPQTDIERRYTAWLLTWDAETAETIADMIERRVTGPAPSTDERTLAIVAADHLNEVLTDYQPILTSSEVDRIINVMRDLGAIDHVDR